MGAQDDPDDELNKKKIIPLGASTQWMPNWHSGASNQSF